MAATHTHGITIDLDGNCFIGLRDDNVCGLQWTWEVPLPEVGRSVLVVPSEAFRSKRDHVVVVNDAAWSSTRCPGTAPAPPSGGWSGWQIWC